MPLFWKQVIPGPVVPAHGMVVGDVAVEFYDGLQDRLFDIIPLIDLVPLLTMRRHDVIDSGPSGVYVGESPHDHSPAEDVLHGRLDFIQTIS